MRQALFVRRETAACPSEKKTAAIHSFAKIMCYDKSSKSAEKRSEKKMIPVPKLFRKTRTVRRINEYMENTFNEVLHTTLNPDGPGVIRIHLIPPKKEENALNPSIAIINGTDIVPVNFAWAVMLAEMIRETNRYDGKEIGEADIRDIIARSVESVKKIIPVFSKKQSELYVM